MYKIILLFCFFTIQCVAQTTLPEELDTPRERSDRMIKEMTVKMELNDTQIPIIDSLNFAYAVEMQAKVLDADLGVWRQYRQGNKIMNRKDDELEAVLSPKQFEQYEDFKSEILWQIVGRIF